MSLTDLMDAIPASAARPEGCHDGLARRVDGAAKFIDFGKARAQPAVRIRAGCQGRQPARCRRTVRKAAAGRRRRMRPGDVRA